MNNRLKKVIAWRTLSFSIASIISYLYLGEFKRSIELTAILTVLMTGIHYIFEGFWENKTN